MFQKVLAPYISILVALWLWGGKITRPRRSQASLFSLCTQYQSPNFLHLSNPPPAKPFSSLSSFFFFFSFPSSLLFLSLRRVSRNLFWELLGQGGCVCVRGGPSHLIGSLEPITHPLGGREGGDPSERARPVLGAFSCSPAWLWKDAHSW